MLVALQNQVQLEQIIKKEFSRTDKLILKEYLSLAIRHPSITTPNHYIASRTGKCLNTIKRFIKDYGHLFFIRARRWKDRREICTEMTFLPQWQHIDNLKWLIKKLCFSSLLKFPHFFKKFSSKILLNIRDLLCKKMSHLINPLIYLNKLAYCKSPIKSENRMVMQADKPDYVKKWQQPHKEMPKVAMQQQPLAAQKTKFTQDDAPHILKTISNYENIIRRKEEKIRSGHFDRYDEGELRAARIQLEKYTQSYHALQAQPQNPFKDLR